MTSRRTALILAWAAPTLTVTTTAPAFAASLGPSRLRFSNTTATVGKGEMVVYANTRVQVVDGPEPVRGVVLTVTIDGYPQHSFEWPTLEGWGSTDQIYVEQSGEWDRPVLVTFTATAEGMEPIVATVTVDPPGWWSG